MADILGVHRTTLHRILSGVMAVSTEVAVALEDINSGGAGLWLTMQVKYDLYQYKNQGWQSEGKWVVSRSQPYAMVTVTILKLRCSRACCASRARCMACSLLAVAVPCSRCRLFSCSRCSSRVRSSRSSSFWAALISFSCCSNAPIRSSERTKPSFCSLMVLGRRHDPRLSAGVLLADRPAQSAWP